LSETGILCAIGNGNRWQGHPIAAVRVEVASPLAAQFVDAAFKSPRCASSGNCAANPPPTCNFNPPTGGLESGSGDI